jgi:hypothetical protein
METEKDETCHTSTSKGIDIEEEKESSQKDNASCSNGTVDTSYGSLSRSQKIFLYKLENLYYDDNFANLKYDLIYDLVGNKLNQDKFNSYTKRLEELVGSDKLQVALTYIWDCAVFNLHTKIRALPKNFKYLKEICGNIIPPQLKSDVEYKEHIDKMRGKYRDKLHMIQDDYFRRTQRIEGNSKLNDYNFTMSK